MPTACSTRGVLGEVLVDIADAVVACAHRFDLGALTGQLDTQLAHDHLHTGGDRQREQCAEHAEQRAADQQRDEDERR